MCGKNTNNTTNEWEEAKESKMKRTTCRTEVSESTLTISFVFISRRNSLGTQITTIDKVPAGVSQQAMHGKSTWHTHTRTHARELSRRNFYQLAPCTN